MTEQTWIYPEGTTEAQKAEIDYQQVKAEERHRVPKLKEWITQLEELAGRDGMPWEALDAAQAALQAELNGFYVKAADAAARVRRAEEKEAFDRGEYDY